MKWMKKLWGLYSLAAVQGPDCLRDIIPKLGVRLKVYQRIKMFYDQEVYMLLLSHMAVFTLCFQNTECVIEELDDSCSVASSKVHSFVFAVMTM